MKLPLRAACLLIAMLAASVLHLAPPFSVAFGAISQYFALLIEAWWILKDDEIS